MFIFYVVLVHLLHLCLHVPQGIHTLYLQITLLLLLLLQHCHTPVLAIHQTRHHKCRVTSPCLVRQRQVCPQQSHQLHIQILTNGSSLLFPWNILLYLMIIFHPTHMRLQLPSNPTNNFLSIPIHLRNHLLNLPPLLLNPLPLLLPSLKTNL